MLRASVEVDVKDQSFRPAVVMGLEHPRAVAAISSLGEMGVPVIGVDWRPAPRARASRFLRETHFIGPSEEETLACLHGLGARGRCVLIPTTDEYLIMVSRHAAALSEQFVLTVPTWDVLGPLMDIPSCYALAGELGMKTPRLYQPRDLEDLRAIIASLDLEGSDYILRTPLGEVAAVPGSERHTKPAGRDAQTFEANCLEIEARLGSMPLIAEVIPGEANQCIGVSMVAGADYEAIVAYCCRRLTLYSYGRGEAHRHPYELGANVYCESIRDDEALDAARRFVRHARYRGAITVEFRRDPRDNSLVLIKADTRLVRATSLSRALGIDIPTALYRDAVGEPPAPFVSYREGVHWLWLTPYCYTLWMHRGNSAMLRKLAPLALQLHRLKALAYWSSRDPMPFLVDLRLMVQVAAGRILRRALSVFPGVRAG
jgi:predicted ATP-grasp superfamily ATP-dependent carboligase